MLSCDLIMKGGITSGVIYPRLVAKLSEHYRFRNIGGSSAGAIAASAAAAAEYGRLNGKPGVFAELDQLPTILGEIVPGSKHSRLFHFFQPSLPLRPHFDVLIAALNVPGKTKRVAMVIWGAICAFPFAAFAGAIPGLFLLFFLAKSAHHDGVGFLLLVASVIGLLLAVVGSVIAVGISFVLSLGKGLPRNYFGVCTGMPTVANEKGPDSLTPWLHKYLDTLAGLAPEDGPLTFGHLWGCRDRREPVDLALARKNANARNINLEMMTTAVSQGLPFRIPFKENVTNTLHFDADEWTRLFPAEIMRWIVDHSVESATVMHPETHVFLRRIPAPEDFPVIAAVRMSLSFPILLCAIPLYAVDWTRTVAANTKVRKAERIWFSDGGITSNIPLHFFDAKLPGHPTFAVNLKSFHPDHMPKTGDKPGAENGRVYLPTNNNQGIGFHWTAQKTGDGIPGVFGFVWSIVETMHNWHDNIQLPYPGYRDRIAQVSQKKHEGGLNLDMPKNDIRALGIAGVTAAQTIIDRFAVPSIAPEDKDGWQIHRSIRFRTFMGLLEELVVEVADSNLKNDWDALCDSLKAYRFPSDRHEALAHAMLDHVKAAKQTVDSAQIGTHGPISLQDKAPNPRASLRITPNF